MTARPSTLVEREVGDVGRVALGRRSDDEAYVFDPGSGAICEPPVQAATIVNPPWLPGYVIAGHQGGDSERAVVISRDGLIADRCVVVAGAWISTAIDLAVGQIVRFDWFDDAENLIERFETPPLDREALESPRWTAYGPCMD